MSDIKKEDKEIRSHFECESFSYYRPINKEILEWVDSIDFDELAKRHKKTLIKRIINKIFRKKLL
jgi:hypothetical protein